MIISFKHQFVFVAIPKTASHTFRVALRPYLHQNDWEQCHLLEKKAFPVEALAKVKHGHFTYEQIRHYLPAGVWERFFSFCTVRNPYDRFVSHCFFRYRDNQVFLKDPLAEMKRLIKNPPEHLKPQYKYVFNDDGKLMVNYVARLEKLQEDFNHICSQTNLPKVQLKHINPAKHPPYQKAFDAEVVDLVKEYYAKDFELFGYSTDFNMVFSD